MITKYNLTDRLIIEYADCDNQDGVKAFTTTFIEKYNVLDLFFFNAGIVTDIWELPANTPLDVIAFNKCMYVNAMAPVHMLVDLEPLLTKTFKLRGGEIKKPQQSDYTTDDTKVRCIFTSSMLSTMDYHSHPMVPMYSASKAAMNHLLRHYHLTWPHLAIDIYHPGYVMTKLSPAGAITCEESAQGLWQTIAETSTIPNANKKLMWYNNTTTDF